MTSQNIKKIWSLNEKEFASMLDSGVFQRIRPQIRFYAPSFTYYKNNHYSPNSTSFPSISVTGSACSINCKHCGGKVLQTMHPALQPEELLEIALKVKHNGASGVLVSGGCLPDGSVPLDRFVSSLKKIKRELSLTVFVHTGIISYEAALALKDAGVDAALIDVIGSEETVDKVYNLKVSVKHYINSLHALNEAKIAFVPHVIVGLNDGKLDGELAALEMIEQVEPSGLVIIAFMPIQGTVMANIPPPNPFDIAKVVSMARKMFPSKPLALGCMRPKGKSRSQIDILALKAGIDGIAFPSEEAIEYAKNNGFRTFFSSSCCAQMYLDVTSNPSVIF